MVKYCSYFTEQPQCVDVVASSSHLNEIPVIDLTSDSDNDTDLSVDLSGK